MTDSAIKDKLTQAGFKTTSLSQNEASFEYYGLSLGNNVKEMVKNSFDCDADYDLQARIASMFGNQRNVMQHNNFVGSLRKMGLTVNVGSIHTQYMVDEKSAGHGSRIVKTGNIAVYTISDGKGGEIVIADANGNAAIEIEEVFMNQILSDIALDVDLIKKFEGEGINIPSSVKHDALSQQEKENEEKVSQADYNSKVEAYIRQTGVTVSEAENRVNINLHVNNLSYTGFMKDKKPAEDENNFVLGKK